MLRTPVVFTVAVLYAILHQIAVRTIDSASDLLVFTALSALIALWAAKARGAYWRELVAGFAISLGVLFAWRSGEAIGALMYGGSGLFLAPLLSRELRAREPEIVVKPRKALSIAMVALGVPIFLSLASGAPIRDAIEVAAMVSAGLHVIVSAVALGLSLALSDRPKVGIWTGAVSSLTFLIAFSLWMAVVGERSAMGLAALRGF